MRLEIAAAAMSSCLGPLITACAAFRAGLTHARASREFQYFPEGDNAPAPLVTCAIPDVTFGFSAAGRLIAILHETLLDLQGRVSLQELGADTPLFLVLPDALERDFPMRPELREDATRRRDVLGTFILKQAFDNLGVVWRGGWRCFMGGHVAFARALQAAREVISSREAKACLVVAVDSLLSPPTLHSLALRRCLKTEDHPVGFIPGEAGVALLLRPVKGRLDSRAPAPVLLDDVCVLESSEPERADGRDLAACVERVLPPGASASEEPLLVSDYNGEQRRAQEWGGLLLHLRMWRPEWRLERSWFPALGFGETGVVSGALGVCVVLRGFERGYARVRSGVVLTSEDRQPLRAAILLSTSEKEGRA
ncbi:hypothetical protein OV208_35975 [Corallococcus sp. bb12-1]|uniref:hypothetical protein n=1 Tax=Corallococcus sp. bb12-1 TaxID=2996784 RepID=UPI002271691F|nr:hypothetical protein [Corallococcus sp. bb12-1]MCY1046758.1 hypothetical protein [Corallococcus sp. bb12-1]